MSFSCAGTSFLPFFDKQRRCNARADRVIGPSFFDIVLV
jgi:hypothetical protein